MKAIVKSLSIIIALGNFTFSIAELSIDQKIENIKNAPSNERVQMMNQFKLQMAQMNQQDRVNAIHKLQDKILNQKQETSDKTDNKMTRPNLDEYMDNSLKNTQYIQSIR